MPTVLVPQSTFMHNLLFLSYSSNMPLEKRHNWITASTHIYKHTIETPATMLPPPQLLWPYSGIEMHILSLLLLLSALSLLPEAFSEQCRSSRRSRCEAWWPLLRSQTECVSVHQWLARYTQAAWRDWSVLLPLLLTAYTTTTHFHTAAYLHCISFFIVTTLAVEYSNQLVVCMCVHLSRQ